MPVPNGVSLLAFIILLDDDVENGRRLSTFGPLFKRTKGTFSVFSIESLVSVEGA